MHPLKKLIIQALLLCLAVTQCDARGGGHGGRGGGHPGGRGGAAHVSRGGMSRGGARASHMRPASGIRSGTQARSISRSGARTRSTSHVAARSHTASRTGARSGLHGYGHRYAHGGRGYGHGWGHGWYGGRGFGWGWGWGAGFGFGFWIPTLLISSLYAGYYPYWGYGLGYGDQLVVLAQNNDWDEIRALLEAKLNELNDALANKQELTQAQIDEIQQQINRIEAHLDGLTQPHESAQ